MKQFDKPKKKKTGETEDSDEEADDLAAALDDLEEDDENERMDWENDMRADMTAEEVKELEESVKPVRRVLGKVS